MKKLDLPMLELCTPLAPALLVAWTFETNIMIPTTFCQLLSLNVDVM